MEKLVDAGCNKAMHAAAEYCRTNGVKPDVDRLIVALRAECKVALDEGMADAKEAFAAGMLQIAQTTFFASFVTAGIRAAKSVA